MEGTQILDRLLEEGIKPHVEKIAEICIIRRVAVVVFEPSDDTAGWLNENLSWKGEPVFPLTAKQRAWLAESWLDAGDKIGARWIRGKGGIGRILVVSGNGTLLVNFKPGQGYTFEPGSTGR